jgi:hypothetical protein
MPPHLAASPGRRRHFLLVPLALVLALLLGGCGGKDEPEQAEAEDEPRTATSAPADTEPAPDPGYGAAKVGECHRMTAAQSYASVDTSRTVKCSAAHTSVVAHVAYLPKPVTPATPLAKRKALGKRWCRPAYQRLAGGTLADRATSILTWTLFTPGQAELERGARWVRCDVVARSGAKLTRLPAKTPFLARGVPEQLRICQTDAGADVSCSQPHAFRVEAVYRAVGKAYPSPPGYTAVARARCQQLLGSFGGFWQPPSRAGWAAGDRFVRCLRPATDASGG